MHFKFQLILNLNDNVTNELSEAIVKNHLGAELATTKCTKCNDTIALVDFKNHKDVCINLCPEDLVSKPQGTIRYACIILIISFHKDFVNFRSITVSKCRLAAMCNI